jgi:hypothetical protein
MKLPLRNGTDSEHFKARRCPVCGAKGLHEPNSFATLESAHLELGWHGGHSDMEGQGQQRDKSASTTAVEDTKSGGYIMFCSLKCLRAFFSSSVDDLEAKVRRAR